jgi:DNA-binding beta-propeller fold protein YncE
MKSRLLRVICRVTLSALLFACLAAPALSAQMGSIRQEPGASSADLLYVCNQDDATIDVIDIGTLAVVRTIRLQELGFGPAAKPHHVVVEPDGSFWYVSLIGENKVLKFDRQDRIVGQVSFETPGMLALHPTQDLLFVGRSMTAVNPPQRIGTIPRSSMAKVDELDIFFPRPHALAVGPVTGVVYTASLGVNQMASVRAETEEVELVDVEGPQHALMQFAISPDGRTLVASAELSHKLLVFDLADPMKPQLVRSIDVGAQPFDPVFTRDGRWVYLGNKAANTITVVDAQPWTVAKVIDTTGIAQPHGTVTSPDGRYVFVSNNNLKDAHAMHGGATPPTTMAGSGGRGTVVVIDAATRAVVKVIEVGRNTTGIGARQPS